MRPVGIELFCGCGGMSTGLLDAGIRIAAGFDKDRPSIDSYNYNHSYRGSVGMLEDLSAATGKKLLERAGLERADLLVGGPPCQAFSIIGKRRGLEDERASLVLDFLRLTEELRPQAVVLENVPSIATAEGGGILSEILSTLKRLRYGVRAETLLAASFGVPQMRKRLIVIGIRDRSDVMFPKTTHGDSQKVSGLAPFVSVAQALDDLPDAGDFGECGIYNHERTLHTADMLARFAVLAPGTREKGSFHDRLHGDRPSYTLRAGTGNFSPLRPVHHRYDRVITVRESARIQGFSDDFIWPDCIPRLQQYRQVGNAVPPPLAQAIGAAIAGQLNWDLDAERLRGNPRSRPSAISMTDEERKADRMKRIRGASLGAAAWAD